MAAKLFDEYLDGRMMPDSVLLDMEQCISWGCLRRTTFLGASPSLDLLDFVLGTAVLADKDGLLSIDRLEWAIALLLSLPSIFSDKSMNPIDQSSDVNEALGRNKGGASCCVSSNDASASREARLPEYDFLREGR
jgi:hypothetical protein